jgi:predicted small secreted protein
MLLQMKRLIITLAFLVVSFTVSACDGTQEPKKIQQDTTTNKRTILDDWAESLDKRNFSEDTKEFKEDVKEFGEEVKQTVEEYTPEVENFMKSLGEYFKR